MSGEYDVPGVHPDLDDYLDRLATEAAAFRDDVDADLDVVYGPSEAQRIDFFTPDEAPDAIALFFHGGFWVQGDRKSHSHLARGPLGHRLEVGVVGYDLAPGAGLDVIVDQAKAAVSFAAERTSLPVVVVGHSAGGHLAAMAVADPTVATSHGVAVSGIFDLEPLVDLPLNKLLQLDAAEATRLSPIRIDPAESITLQLAVGEAEPDEWHQQSLHMVQRWGARAGYHTIAGEHHLSVIETLADPDGTLAGLCRTAADRAAA